MSFYDYLNEMAARFTPISRQQMEDFLVGQLGFYEKPIPLDRTRELVYGKVERRGESLFSVRVYTGIEPSGNSRDVGKDAIRVEVYYKDKDNKVHRIGGSKRVHRTQNWQKNLASRINDWQSMIGPPCQHCGAPTVERKNRRTGDTFMSCVRWKECQAERQQPEPKTQQTFDDIPPWEKDDNAEKARQQTQTQQPPPRPRQRTSMDYARDRDDVPEAPPICPGCGDPKVKRTNRSTGQEFWGCRNWPNCKG